MNRFTNAIALVIILGSSVCFAAEGNSRVDFDATADQINVMTDRLQARLEANGENLNRRKAQLEKDWRYLDLSAKRLTAELNACMHRKAVDLEFKPIALRLQRVTERMHALNQDFRDLDRKYKAHNASLRNLTELVTAEVEFMKAETESLREERSSLQRELESR